MGTTLCMLVSRRLSLAIDRLQAHSTIDISSYEEFENGLEVVQKEIVRR